MRAGESTCQMPSARECRGVTRWAAALALAAGLLLVPGGSGDAGCAAAQPLAPTPARRSPERPAAGQAPQDPEAVVAASRGTAVRLLVEIAGAQRARGELADAEESLRRALEVEPEPEVAFTLGRLLLTRGALERAETVFASLLEWSGGRAEVRVLVGGAYAEAGFLEPAIRELRAAVESDPELATARVSLGYAYLALAAGQSNPAAERELRRAVALDPASYDANYYLGQVELLEGRRREAAGYLEAAAAARPGSPEPWLQRGLDAFSHDEPGTAEADLRRGLELADAEPGRSADLARRACAAMTRIALVRGDRAEAERWFGCARQAAAGAGGAASAVGTGRRERAATGAAIATPAAALAGPPAVGGVRTGAAGDASSGLLAGGDPTGDGASRSAARDPGLAAAPVAGGSAAVPDGAPAAADALPALGERLAAVYNDWGTAEARRGDFAEAVRQYREAERWDPDAPGLMRNLGLAAFQTGDHAEAARALGRAVEADPGDRAARALLAVSLASADRHAEAADAFAALGDAALDDPRLAYLWARSLARSGRPAEADAVVGRLRKLPLPPEAVAQVEALQQEIEAAAGPDAAGSPACAAPPTDPPPAPPEPRCDNAVLAGYDGLLVIAPHPDDEVLGFAGLAAVYADRGKPVEVVVVTDGDAYCEACQIWKNGSIEGPTCTAAELSNLATPQADSFAEVRRGESAGAAAKLGRPAPEFLGYPDTGIAAAWSALGAGHPETALHRSDFGGCSSCASCDRPSGGYGAGPDSGLTAGSLRATLAARLAAVPPGTLVATTHPLDGHGDHAGLGSLVQAIDRELEAPRPLAFAVIHAHTPKDTRHPDCWYPAPAAVDCGCIDERCAAADPGWIAALAAHRLRPGWPAALPDDADYGAERQLCLPERLYQGEGAAKLAAVVSYASQRGALARDGAMPAGRAGILDCSGYLVGFVRRTEAFVLADPAATFQPE